MKNSLLLAALLLCASLAGAQNPPSFVTVTASSIYNGGPALLPSGTITFQAVNSQGLQISYQVGGGGQQIKFPTVCSITNGAIQANCLIANGFVTSPQNVCFNVVVKNSNNVIVLGGNQNQGYQCVQPIVTTSPSTTAYWCNETTNSCDFDLYVPNVQGVPVVHLPFPSTAQIGGVFASTCTGTEVANGFLPTGYPNCVAGGSGVPITTVAGLAGLVGVTKGSLAVVTNGVSSTDCAIGGGSFSVVCQYTGSVWQALVTAGLSLNVQTNNSANQSQTNLNFLASSPFNGLTFGFTNPTGGNEQLSVSGALGPGGIGTLLAGQNGLANSATTDTTNASNITSGTLPAAQLPFPANSTLGGSYANACIYPEFSEGLGNTGLQICGTPAGVGTITGVTAGTGLSGGGTSGSVTVTLANPIASNTTGNAATATALSATPAQCTTNKFSTGIASNGNSNCTQPSAANLSNGTTGTGAIVLATGNAAGFTGNLNGDVTGTQTANSVVKVNGVAPPVSKTIVGTNGAGQFVDASSATLANNTTGTSSGFTGNLAGDVSGAQGATVVGGIKSVPLCSGFTPTNGQTLQYTTASSPNPCYTAVNTTSGGTITGVSGGTGITGGGTSGSVTVSLVVPVSVPLGGTGLTSAPTGIVRGGNPYTASELSGDVQTSGSNAATVIKVNGASVPASKNIVGTNSAGQLVDASSTTLSNNTTGNAGTANSATNFTGSLAGDVTGAQSTTSVVKVNGLAVPASKTIVGTNSSGQIVDASSASLTNNTSGNSSGFTGSLGGDVSGSQSSTTVQALRNVPFCTGFTPTNGQVVEYTTTSSPNPCYTSTAAGGTGTITGVTAGTGMAGGGSSGTVTVSIAPPVSVANGGSGTTSILSGVMRGGNPMSATELSGDAQTSGSNAVTVKGTNGASLPVSATIVGTNGAGQIVSATSSTLTNNTTGNAATATTAVNFSGSLSGDVTGTQSSTTVARVNGLAVPTSKTIVGTNSSGQIIDASSATLANNTTGNAATATNSTEIGGITVSGTPAAGYVPTAINSTAATWQASGAGSLPSGSQCYPLVNTNGGTGYATTGTACDASQFNPTSTMDVRIASAIAALPTGGGVVDARAINGTQFWAADPFAALRGTGYSPTTKVTLLLCNVTINTKATVTLVSGTHLIGCGRESVTIQAASSGFPVTDTTGTVVSTTAASGTPYISTWTGSGTNWTSAQQGSIVGICTAANSGGTGCGTNNGATNYGQIQTVTSTTAMTVYINNASNGTVNATGTYNYVLYSPVILMGDMSGSSGANPNFDVYVTGIHIGTQGQLGAVPLAVYNCQQQCTADNFTLSPSNSQALDLESAQAQEAGPFSNFWVVGADCSGSTTDNPIGVMVRSSGSSTIASIRDFSVALNGCFTNGNGATYPVVDDSQAHIGPGVHLLLGNTGNTTTVGISVAKSTPVVCPVFCIASAGPVNGGIIDDINVAGNAGLSAVRIGTNGSPANVVVLGVKAATGTTGFTNTFMDDNNGCTITRPTSGNIESTLGQYALNASGNIGISTSATATCQPAIGININSQSSVTTTYTYSAVTDLAAYTIFNSTGAVAVTLPQANTFPSGWFNKTCNYGGTGSVVTITPTTSTISYTTGSARQLGQTSVALSVGQCIEIKTATAVNGYYGDVR